MPRYSARPPATPKIHFHLLLANRFFTESAHWKIPPVVALLDAENGRSLRPACYPGNFQLGMPSISMVA